MVVQLYYYLSPYASALCLSRVRGLRPTRRGREMAMVEEERLRRVRQQRGLTQTALGKLVGQDKQYIYKVEYGLRSSITTTMLARLVTALEVSADYLLGFSDCATLPAPGGNSAMARRPQATV